MVLRCGPSLVSAGYRCEYCRLEKEHSWDWSTLATVLLPSLAGHDSACVVLLVLAWVVERLHTAL